MHFGFPDPKTYLHTLDVILTNIESFVDIQEVLFFQVRPNLYISVLLVLIINNTFKNTFRQSFHILQNCGYLI